MYTMGVQCCGPAEGIGSPGTGVMDVCELLCWCWESNPGWEEQPVLLTAEPSLQPSFHILVLSSYLLLFKFVNT